MSRNLILSLVFIIALTFIVSCSGGDGNMVTPTPTDRDTVATPTPGATTCFGLWQVTIDPATGTGDIVQLRSADKIINVLGFMEPPPLTLMDLDWPNLVIDIPPGTAEVGVILQHPIAGDAVFNGFDVRGVCFGPKVTNADGLTIIPSPEFFSGVPFGYMDGLLGSPDSFGNYEGLAGYKYFCDDLGPVEDLATFFIDTDNLANRGMFTSGATNQRDYLLDWNGTGYALLVFNYAIYANYDWPVGDPPITIDSFEITTANSAEAFCAIVTETSNSLWYSEGVGGGSIGLDVEIWDWQGDITTVSMESKDAGIIAESFFDVYAGPGGTANSYIYQFIDVPAVPTTAGDLDIIITATDAKTFGASWFLDLLDPGHDMFDVNVYNCFMHTATVIECPIPTVTGTYMGAGVIDDKSIYCTNLIDGTSLAVKLTDGTTDYVGTDVTYVSATELTADFDLTAATFGDILDVMVTNGCGTEGSAVNAWEVINWIYPITPYNIDTVTGYDTPNDITCNPAADDVMISYATGGDVKWGSDYTTLTSYPEPGGRMSKYIDSTAWGVFAAEDNSGCAPTEYPVWGWQDWTGVWNGSHYWFGMCTYVSKDMAGSVGQTTVWDCVDMVGYYYFIGSDAWGSMNYFYFCGSPMYNGSGTTGVLTANFLAAEGAGTSNIDLYILEDLPATSTAVVEKWNISGGSYLGWSAGEDLLADAIDVTTRTDGVCFVLEEDGDGDPNIWAFSATDGSLIGKSGKIDDSVISGDVLRMDAYNFSDPDEIHVLHSDGVTMFGM